MSITTTFECGYTTPEVLYTLLHIPQFSELYNGDNSCLPDMPEARLK